MLFFQTLFSPFILLWQSPLNIKRIEEQMSHITDELESLRTNVASLGTVVDSAIVLIEGLADQIEELKGDEIALQELANEVRSKAEALAAAVDANDGVDFDPSANA